MVQVYCKNTKESKRFPEGTSLLQMLSEFDCHRPYPIVSAKVNNVSQGLKFKVYQNKDIEFIDVRESSGMRVYCRSLFFLLYKACCDVLPGSKLYVEHPISHGYFCHIRKADDSPITPEDIQNLSAYMQELFEKVQTILAKQLRVDASRITPDSQIKKDLGADSLDILQLLMRIEDQYGIVIPDQALAQFNTVGDVVSYLETRANGFPEITYLLSEGFSPAQILDLFMGDPDLEYLDGAPVSFTCSCSKERMSEGLATLGQSELEELASGSEGIDTQCHFCNKKYHFDPEEIKKLIT